MCATRIYSRSRAAWKRCERNWDLDDTTTTANLPPQPAPEAVTDDSAPPTPDFAQAFAALNNNGGSTDNTARGNTNDDVEVDAATFVAGLAERIAAEVHKAVQGQEEVVEAALVALLAGGHALFEGNPRTSSVFAVPGLPSNSACPPASRATSAASTTSS